MRKNSHVIGIVILSLSAVLILFGIHRLETIQATPEYKAEQILAQDGWSASQFNDFTSRSSQISKGFLEDPTQTQLEEIAQANAAIGLPGNTDFLTQENLIVYLIGDPTYTETQQTLVDYPDYAYSIYCFLDGSTLEPKSVFLRGERIGTSEWTIYPLTLTAEEAAALPR